jgi:aspartyl-tRNA(Asn)/glutamyl-tRNA(Gln) amidotransferase subunit C
MKINVKHIAMLANLALNPDEEKKFETQISNILEYIEKINTADVKDVEPTSQITGLENIIREDSTTPSLTQEEALSGTEGKHNGMFKVKAILEDS